MTFRELAEAFRAEDIVLATTDRAFSVHPARDHYRVVAFPVVYAISDDVIIGDQSGRQYLLTHESPQPTPLERDEVDSLGMFFEPSQDYSWHTVPELRRILYGTP
jgi:hypothetical protein